MDAVTCLKEVRLKIQNASAKAGRDVDDVNLIAISKSRDASAILPVLELGHLHYGENRVQEAASKWPELLNYYPDVVLHFIGPLQSNKVKEAVTVFDVIHTIDRPKIAKAIAFEMQKQSKLLKFFVQVNTGEEKQKTGISPDDARDFVNMCRSELRLDVIGLMCIPPVNEEPNVHFEFLAKLARSMNLKKLSMGMSRDFETAISLGATHLRVGSTIFGTCKY
ncbi:MAG: YggS family pyridoxal phosphate-dependent enzyme [Hyphomicrobiaceae bacterium]|nr:YggS family pyridoxal phosphate-dependent enzyme [Hyphomicrobiaceae bacterium]